MVPAADVRFDLGCAGPGRKDGPAGTARSWSIDAAPDVLWALSEPAPGFESLAGWATFDHDRARVELVDGAEAPSPATSRSSVSPRGATPPPHRPAGRAALGTGVTSVSPAPTGGARWWTAARCWPSRWWPRAATRPGGGRCRPTWCSCGRPTPAGRRFDLQELGAGRTFTTLAAQVSQDGRACAHGTLLLDATAPDVIRHGVPVPDVAGPYDSEPYDMSVTGRDLRIVDGAYTGDPTPPRAPPCSTPGCGSGRSPTTAPARGPAGPVHRPPVDRGGSPAPRGDRPAPGPPQPLHRHQRHRPLAARGRAGRPLDALPAPLDLRGRRHDPRRVPRARRGWRPCWPRSRWMPWCARFPGGGTAPTAGPRCEPDHRPRAAGPPPGGALQRGGPARRRLRRALPPPGTGAVGGRAAVDSEHVAAGPPSGRTARLRLPRGRRVRGGGGRARARGARLRAGAVERWRPGTRRTSRSSCIPATRTTGSTASRRRRLRVEVAGTALVDTDDTLGVYETALEPRLYVGREHVRMDLLVPSPTTHLLPLQGHGVVLGRGGGGRHRRRRGVVVRGPAAREPVAGRHAQLRRGPGHSQRGPPACGLTTRPGRSSVSSSASTRARPLTSVRS